MNLPRSGHSKSSSFFGLALGLLAVASSVVAWIYNTGQYSYLIFALAFAAMTPSWYLRPLDLKTSLSDQFTRRAAPLPDWAQRLLLAGLLLFAVALVIRFTS